MNKILEHLNYTIDEQQSPQNKVVLTILNNPDGSPRWICSKQSKKPLFLNFYMVNNFRSSIFARVIRTIFAFKLQGVVFKKQIVFVKPFENKQPIIDLTRTNWAIFTGTVGPNNKMLVFQENESGNSFFKIATTKQAQKIIENEEKTIQKVSTFNSSYFYIPKIKSSVEKCLEIQDISNLSLRYNSLEKVHINALQEINKLDKKVVDWKLFSDNLSIDKNFQDLEDIQDKRIPRGIIKKLKQLREQSQTEEIHLGFSHGDFTPWNMYKDGEKMALYDWELANNNFPIGFDAFHFILQKGILIERKSWKTIRTEIDAIITPEVISMWTDGREKSVEKYLKYYLLANTTHYLEIYSKQKEWHVQIQWLLDTWNEAISDVLANGKNERQLMIIDLFDFLHTKNYTTVKFHDGEPELLSEYSDIDFCIKKSDRNEIQQFLTNHFLVLKNNTIHKSFMDATNLVLTNGSLLSLDFIWKFKRKELVFLNARKVLERKETNAYGVNIMNGNDLAHYIGMFYGLNESIVPEKYTHYTEYLHPENSKLEKVLKEYFLYDKLKRVKLIRELNKWKENKFLSFAFNKLNYYRDTIKQLMANKGIIITFSGVDGAGKSTIIENIKHEIEKRLRRKVVVIRHRPSLLPILSAITKGKEQAEKDAANRLPRQGNNKSSISSLIRFMYYYFDYFVGQFYINFKYKYRGIIVLYDRYYYDFINDAKRSNININEGIVKFGYNFVFTPDLNFFLYADPEIILKRKQELSAETITELTEKYSNLFNTFETRKKKQNYHLVNNIDLNTTIEFIMKNINTKLK
jgi:thymidylate kinase